VTDTDCSRCSSLRTALNVERADLLRVLAQIARGTLDPDLKAVYVARVNSARMSLEEHEETHR
jgi:hypothetical protein